jgi:hypothetical protein
MFQKIAEGSPISIQIDYKDDSGAELTGVVSIDWKLIDESGRVIQSGTLMPTPGENGVRVDIDGYLNVPVGAFSVSTYELSYTILLQVGQHSGSTVYQVEKRDAFTVGVSTFASYLQALSLLREIPDMGAFSAATKDERVGAMMYAYDEIGALEFNNAFLPRELRLDANKKPITSTMSLTPGILSQVSQAMLKDFAVAQIIEANALLGGDEIARLRDQGVQSYSVGEVKQFFRGRPAATFGLNQKALRRIGKYMRFTRSSARA